MNFNFINIFIVGKFKICMNLISLYLRTNNNEAEYIKAKEKKFTMVLVDTCLFRC